MNPNFMNNLQNTQNITPRLIPNIPNMYPSVNQNAINIMNPLNNNLTFNNARPIFNIPSMNINHQNPMNLNMNMNMNMPFNQNQGNMIINNANQQPIVNPLLNSMNMNIKDKLEYVRKVYIGKFPPTLDNNFLIKLLEVSKFLFLDLWCNSYVEKIN
jgi:hypothetical protein